MSSTYTPITLSAKIQSITGSSIYGEVDGTGLQNKFKTYDAVIYNIAAQTTGDGSTREGNRYNGLDIEAGMWISDDSGETILKIVSIEAKSEISITCVLEDVDMLSYRINNKNSIATNGNIVIFDTNEEGEAILADTSGLLSGKADSIQSRFQLNERDDRVKFEHSVAPSVSSGDIVTIDSNGNLVPFGDLTAASDLKVGTVVEEIRNGKDVYIKPFNDLILKYSNPEALTGASGTTYYTDSNSAGDITTVVNSSPVFIQLNAAIPTTLTATNGNLPGSTDIVEINGITVFDGPGGDSVADLATFVTLIDGFSATTFVEASTFTAPGSVSSDDNTLAYAGSWASHDVFIPIALAGQTPSSYAEITLSDGTNTANIVFDTPDAVVNFGSDYDVMSPTAIKDEFQAAITANGLDLTVTLIDLASGNGQGIKLETTGAATGITMTNVSSDAFGNPAVGTGSSTGMDLTASLGSSVLRLTRNSGGDIKIDGSPISGGYINQGGMTSSNNGRVPFLMLIEATGAGAGAPDGAETFDDLNQTANITSVDGDFTGATISNTPYNDSNVQILVNGVNVNLGDGSKNQACYFSADGGSTPRLITEISQSDALYWNGSIAGYELDGLDEIDIIYEK